MKVIENTAAQISGFGVKMMFVTQSLAQLKAIYKDSWETFLANTGVKIFFGNDDHFSREHISKLIGECEVLRKTRNASQTNGTGYSIAKNETRGGSKAFSRGGSRSLAKTDNWSHGHGLGLLSFSSNRGGGRSVTTSESWNESETSSWNESETATQSVNYSDTMGHSDTLHKRNLVNPNEIGLMFGDRDNPKAIVLISGQQPLQVSRTAYFQDAQFAGLYDPHPDHGKPPTLVARQVSIHEQMNRELAIMLQNLERTKANTEWQAQSTITEFEDTLSEAETVRQEGYQSLIRRLSWVLPLSVIFIIFSVIAFFIGVFVIAAESGLF